MLAKMRLPTLPGSSTRFAMNYFEHAQPDFPRGRTASIGWLLHRHFRGCQACLLGFGLAALFAGSATFAANATVSWNSNPETDIAGYRLAYGTTLGVYNNQINVGTNPTTSVSGLTAGTTYYFVVSAINRAGLQSQPSAVVSYWVPTVTPTNRAPVALANSLTVPEDTALNVVLTGTDADNNPLTFAVVNSPTKGALTGTPPNLKYTPTADYSGADSFTFIANDGSLNSAAATVSITVTPVNDAPAAVSKTVATSKNTQLPILLGGSDKDSFTLSYTVLTQPASGALAGTAPNLTYTPANNFVGTDKFTYRVRDGALDSAVATITINVAQTTIPNTAPVALAQALTVPEDTALNVVLRGTDAENSPLAFTVTKAPTKGVLTGTPPNLKYTPTADYYGADSFNFVANDGSLNSSAATVSITVSSVNDAPVAVSKSVATTRNTPLVLQLQGTDKEASALTYTVLTQPASGTLAGTAPNLTYTPASNFVGSDKFTYRVRDGALNSTAATVTITVAQAILPPTNTAPVAAAQALTVQEDTPINITLAGNDKESSALTFTVVDSPTNGSLSGIPPNLIYTPGANFVGADNFTFRASDGALGSALATITIDVTQAPAPTPPTPTPTTPTTLSANLSPQFTDNPITLADAKERKPYLGATLAGSAVDTDAVTYWKVSGPAWLQVATNGDLSGTPPPNSAGLNAFVVRAADSALATADAELLINVTGLPLPWKTGDIGDRQLTGASFFEAGKFTESGSGALGGVTDTLRFTYQILTRNGAITARVAALPENGIDGRFGVMIRGSLAQNSPQVFMGLSNENTFRWVTRTTAGGKTTTKTGTTRTESDTWVRLVSYNGKIMAYRSSNGVKWTFVGMTEIDMPRECYIGLAVSSGNNETLRTVHFRNVSVTP